MIEPLTIAEEEELLRSSRDRLRAASANWVNDPKVRRRLRSPAPGQNDGSYEHHELPQIKVA